MEEEVCGCQRCYYTCLQAWRNQRGRHIGHVLNREPRGRVEYHLVVQAAASWLVTSPKRGLTFALILNFNDVSGRIIFSGLTGHLILCPLFNLSSYIGPGNSVQIDISNSVHGCKTLVLTNVGIL